jgi:hypothetical protein
VYAFYFLRFSHKCVCMRRRRQLRRKISASLGAVSLKVFSVQSIPDFPPKWLCETVPSKDEVSLLQKDDVAPRFYFYMLSTLCKLFSCCIIIIIVAADCSPECYY